MLRLIFIILHDYYCFVDEPALLT